MALHAARLRHSRALRVGGVLGVAALLSGIAVLLAGVASAQTTLLSDHFASPTSSSPVTYASNGATDDAGQPFPCLTAEPAPASPTGTIPNCGFSATYPNPDSSDDGALMLTDGGFGEASNIIYDGSFPTLAGLDITFDTHMYGGQAYYGTYADGMSFDLAAAPPVPGAVGQSGGALGYSTDGSAPGMPAGYLGVGLDEYGNYSTTGYEGADCSATDPPWAASSAQPNEVTVHGPGDGTTGYCLISSSLADSPDPMDSISLHGDNFADSDIKVDILIDSTNEDPADDTYSVTLTPSTGADAGTPETVISAAPLPDFYYDPVSGQEVTGIPPRLSFAVAGSTGSGTDVHEINDVDAATLNDTALTTLALSASDDSDQQVALGTPFNYLFTPQVAAGSAVSEADPVTLIDVLPANQVLAGTPSGSGWDCSATNTTTNTADCTYTPSSPIAAGDSLPQVSVPAATTSGAVGDTVTNTATVSSADSEGEASASDTVTLTAAAVPLLDAAISDSDGGSVSLEAPTFTISMGAEVDPGGTAEDDPLTIQSTLPEDVELTGTPTSSDPGWDCSASSVETNTVDCVYTPASSISPGTFLTPVDVPVQLNPTDADGDQFNVVETVSSTDASTYWAPSTATDPITVNDLGVPTITTAPNPTTVTLGSDDETLTDSAVLSGGYYPTGMITFALYDPNGNLVDTESADVDGTGTYTTPTGYPLPTDETVTGTYQWDATYSGDESNNGASDDNDPSEQVVVSSASPTIATTPSASTVTLPTDTPLTDTAVLSGGFNPTGTITFTLDDPNGDVVDTETATVTGNGTYTTPSGYTLPTTGTVTGTYQWEATYSGDGNNNAASDDNDEAEDVVVSSASPTIATTPSPATVTLPSSTPLMDSAVLSDGSTPTGMITFTLDDPNGDVVDTETATVTGNGTYTTPSGYTLPTTGTVTGTYQWEATYSGDGNNNEASDDNDEAEDVVVSSASPTISTTPSPIVLTLGPEPGSLNDTAVLSGGSSPTGTITFTLYDPNNTLVDTETVAVSGNGSYSTPTGYTLPTTGTVTGTYQWDASYSGDGNNAAVSDDSDASEQVIVSSAPPTITSTPDPAAVTLGSTMPVLKDSAVLSGGSRPTGTITFTLYDPNNTLVDTETVTVSGNGSYTTPTGYTLPTDETVTGTYQWDASYSGDGNNTAISDDNAEDEQVGVTSASPTITTTPSPTSVTLPSASPLTDTAVLSDGATPTGTITFTLHNSGNTVVDTETATVNGNGSYTTPTGYMLPSTGTVTGTYQWDASYSGDSNNAAASDDNATDEQVVVSSASPTITTTASPTTVTLPSASPLMDTAVLAGGFHATGTITFTLFDPSHTLVDTETVTVSGNGSYTTPTGYPLPTSGTVTGTYQWDASYSGDGNDNAESDTDATDEQVVVSKTSPTITTTPSPTTVTLPGSTPLTDTAVLSDGATPTGTITFTLHNSGDTVVDTETVTVSGNGSYSTPTGYTLPTTGTVTGTYQWDATYSGDGNNNSATDDNDAGERVVVSKASPTITTTPNPTTVAPGSSPPVLNDSAVLANGGTPTGTITFTLYNPGHTLVDTETVTVSGNGTYTTPTGYTAPSMGLLAGTYQWDASYSGDGNNNAATDDNDASEQVVVSKTSPTITTAPTPTAVTVPSSTPLMDAATLSDGASPTGTITFTLYDPNGPLVDTETATVSGNGTYTTPSGYTLPTTGTVTGTYQWDASYSGDGNNNAAADDNATDEQVVVSAGSNSLTTVLSGGGETGASISVPIGTAVTDTATLSGTNAATATGTITYSVYSDSDCATPVSPGTPQTIETPGTLPSSSPYTAPAVGPYYWQASYSGDDANAAALSPCELETVTARRRPPTPTPPVTPPKPPTAPVIPVTPAAPTTPTPPAPPTTPVPPTVTPPAPPTTPLPPTGAPVKIGLFPAKVTPPKITPPPVVKVTPPGSPGHPTVSPPAPLVASHSTVVPGEPTVLTGQGCVPGAQVVLTIAGRQVGLTTANSQGAFSTSFTPSNDAAGQVTITASCGSMKFATLLSMVTAAAVSAPEGAAAVFGTFVLLGAVLLRGQFGSRTRRRSRRRRRASEILAESGYSG